MKRILVIFLVLCSAMPVLSQTDTLGLVWPIPPDQPRIRHLQTIASFESLEPKQGFFEKIVGFLFGGSDTRNWFVQPVGMTIGGDGKLYVADPGAHGVHVLDLDGREYSFVGRTDFGPFLSPVGVAVSADDVLYIADSERNDVVAVRDEYEVLFQIRSHLVRPTGICISGNRLYVVDTGKHAIVVFDLQGTYITEFGRRGAGEGEFNFPVQVTVRDSVFVVDALNYRIESFDTNGAYGSVFGVLGDVPGRFSSPKAVAVDSDGNLYVTDALMDNFQIFNRAGQLLLIVGRKGSRDGEFMSPSGIAIDGKDRIHVVDALNRRIQIFQYLK